MVAAAAVAVAAAAAVTVATHQSHLPPRLHQQYPPPRRHPHPQLDQNHPRVSLPSNNAFPCARAADPSARIGSGTVCICKPTKTRRASRLRQLLSATIPVPSPYRPQGTWGDADSPPLEPLPPSFSIQSFP
uniref:Uncharacterized protein n=1 Tax=Anopheles braziliensis TaxID=58242 RepID=A0A2M3ZLZ7_9DIPT